MSYQKKSPDGITGNVQNNECLPVRKICEILRCLSGTDAIDQIRGREARSGRRGIDTNQGSLVNTHR